MAGAATTWGAGDYPRMAARLMPAADAVVEAAGVRAGEAVLDVACGTGNAALVAARRGAAPAVGVDLEPALLARAPRDAGVEWMTGDALALPLDDDAFDVAVSVFGVMYAPDHARAAAELARVTRTGGRMALASWIPGGFLPSMGAALAPFLPPPSATSAPPARWGDPAHATALLHAAGFTAVEHRASTLTLDFATPDEAVAFLIDTAGHVVAERERLEREGRWNDLRTALAELVDGATEICCDYRLTVAHA
jgi:ubiquinone/menaquinone biosynthesis C-methylase UbiE